MSKNRLETVEDQQLEFATKIEDLTEDIRLIQGDRKNWYKDRSFLLNLIIVLFTAASFVLSIKALNSAIETQNNVEKKEILNGIAQTIDKMRDFEKDFYTQMANVNIDNYNKNNITGVFTSKLSQLCDLLSKSIDSSNLNSISPTDLLDYSRYLERIGNIKDAIRIAKKSLEFSKTEMLQSSANSNLARYYALSGESKNLKESRLHREKAIAVINKDNSDFTNEILTRNFITWANDEYYYNNDKKIGDSVLLRAERLASSLSESNGRKKGFITEIKNLRNYYKGLSGSNINYGRWLVKTPHFTGEAMFYYTISDTRIFINLYKDSNLVVTFNGVGYFVNPSQLRFELLNELVQITNYRDGQVRMPTTIRTALELNIINDKFMRGRFLVAGSQPERWKFSFAGQIQ